MENPMRDLTESELNQVSGGLTLSDGVTITANVIISPEDHPLTDPIVLVVHTPFE
jgi:bacteriocin-like protein